jgi:hypothetical protein
MALAASLILAGLLSPFISEAPDGLEHTLESLGADETGEPGAAAPMPDYRVPGIKNNALALGLAALFGIVIAFVGGLALGRWMLHRPYRRENGGET